jgi:glucokinase
MIHVNGSVADSTATTDQSLPAGLLESRSPGAGVTGADRHRGPVVLAVDIGGTKMAAGLVDGSGQILLRSVAPTPASVDPDVVFAALATVIDRVRDRADLVGCGVGCGGPMAAGGEDVSPLNIPAWRRFPLRRRLQDLLGLPVAVDNDAKALALGEGWTGAAQGVANYLAMVVSTGVGGGIVLDGRLLDGEHGNAGHIGHLVVEPEGRPCTCGSRGCLEAETSGMAIEAVTGRPAAEAGVEVRRRAGTLVGRAVADVANLLDLEVAVVAGSVALGFGAPFFAAAQAEIGARARLDFSRHTRIVPAGLGGDAPLVGAAAVGYRALDRDPVSQGIAP